MSDTIEPQRIEHSLPAPMIEVLPASMAQEITAAIAAAPSTVDADTMPLADRSSAELHRIEKAIEAQRVALKKPINDIGKAIDNICKNASAPVAEARRKINGMIGKHLAEIERQRQEAIRKAEEERRRIEAEARRAAEEAEAERRRQEAQIADETCGLFDGIDMAPEEPPPPPPPPPPQLPAVVIPPPAKSGSVTMRTVKVLRITDRDAIPRIYLDINEARIRAAIASGIYVPGAEMVEEMVAAH